MAFLNRFIDDPTARRDTLGGIIRDLGFLLNSRDGYGSVISAYGLGAYETRQDGRSRAELLAEEVHEEIVRSEPRLRDVTVRLLGRDAQLWLHLKLHATLEGKPVVLDIRFDTLHGQVLVEEAECP